MKQLLFGMLLAAVSISQVTAAQHLMKLREVYVGPTDNAASQYIMLQMYTGGQNQVNGHAVQVFDATDTILGTFTFNQSVANGASQSYILLATSAAETQFGVNADLAMSSVIPLAGGKICFDSFDCVVWGNYSGDAINPDSTGTPFNAGAGLQAARAIRRDISAGNASQLEAGDDTGDSAADFAFADPAPFNNGGTAGEDSYTPPSGGASAPAGGGGSGGGGGGSLGGLSLLALMLAAAFRRRRL